MDYAVDRARPPLSPEVWCSSLLEHGVSDMTSGLVLARFAPDRRDDRPWSSWRVIWEAKDADESWIQEGQQDRGMRVVRRAVATALGRPFLA
eukprot:UN5166